MTAVVKVELPASLRMLAGAPCVVEVAISSPATVNAVLDALEAAYPALRGTMRDTASRRRRPFIRFFACAQDLSHHSLDAALPEAVERGQEPLLIVGAIAGG